MAMTGQDNYGTIATIEQGQDSDYKAAMAVHRLWKGQQLHDWDDRTRHDRTVKTRQHWEDGQDRTVAKESKDMIVAIGQPWQDCNDRTAVTTMAEQPELNRNYKTAMQEHLWLNMHDRHCMARYFDSLKSATGKRLLFAITVEGSPRK